MKVALLTATPVETNSGMFSVDKAALELFSVLNVDFDLFVSQDVDYVFCGKPAKLYFDPEQLYDYTHVVFWGDFVNNPMYGQEDFSSRDVVRGFSSSLEEAFERWSRLYALEGFDKKKLKIMSVGCNFHFDLRKLNTRAKLSVRSIEQNFDLILPRDNYSCLNLANAFSHSSLSIIKLGFDCAFLLVNKFPRTKKYMVTSFFYRSNIENAREINNFLKKNFGYDTKYHSWLSLPSEKEKFFDIYTNDMKSSIFTVTDTYHFAINSIRLGTIPICLGVKQDSQRGTLGDFKKSQLFETIGLNDLYVEISSVDYESACSAIERKVHYVLSNYSEISKRIEYFNLYHVQEFRKKIISFLKN